MSRPGLALTAAVLLLLPATSDAEAGSGPALHVSGAQLDAALHCPDRLDHHREPVLLIHGVTHDSELAWSWNYAKTLPAEGYTVCTIDLPGASMGDTQVSAEYVVGALRRLRNNSGRKVDVITHSWGGVNLLWAVRWWPDIRTALDDAVMLAVEPHGGSAGDVACSAPDGCPPVLWQSRPGSAFLRALNATDDLTGGSASFTTIYSNTDEIAFVAGGSPDPWTASSALAGATNIRVQDVCPGRAVEHVQFLYDAAVNALVLDALEHAGPANPSRIGTGACLSVVMDGVNPGEPLRRSVQTAINTATKLSQGHVAAEPPLAPYAR